MLAIELAEILMKNPNAKVFVVEPGRAKNVDHHREATVAFRRKGEINLESDTVNLGEVIKECIYEADSFIIESK